LLQNISSIFYWLSNLYKATLYSLDSEVEIEGLSMFSEITYTRHLTPDTRHKTQDTRHKTQDTRHKTQIYILYFIFYILYFISYILYSNSYRVARVARVGKEGLYNYPLEN